jgi:hypothetical protein
MNYLDNATPSRMTLGGSDSTAYLGEMTGHSAVKKYNTWWTLNYNGASYNDIELASDPPVDIAIIDTGTSFMYIP